jgi:hypothetical protein
MGKSCDLKWEALPRPDEKVTFEERPVGGVWCVGRTARKPVWLEQSEANDRGAREEGKQGRTGQVLQGLWDDLGFYHGGLWVGESWVDADAPGALWLLQRDCERPGSESGDQDEVTVLVQTGGDGAQPGTGVEAGEGVRSGNCTAPLQTDWMRTKEQEWPHSPAGLRLSSPWVQDLRRVGGGRPGAGLRCRCSPPPPPRSASPSTPSGRQLQAQKRKW